MIGVMEQSVIISFSLSADLLVGLGHAAKAAGRPPADHLRAIVRQALLGSSWPNSVALPEFPVPVEATAPLPEAVQDLPAAESEAEPELIAGPESFADPGSFAELEFIAGLDFVTAPDFIDDPEATAWHEPAAEPDPATDSGQVTARVLARLRSVEEPAPAVFLEEAEPEEDQVLKLVKAVCAVAEDDVPVDTPAGAALIPSDGMIAAELADARIAEGAEGQPQAQAKPASSFGAMTYGILATRNDHPRFEIDRREAGEVTEAMDEAEPPVAAAVAVQPAVPQDDGARDLLTDDILAAVLSVSEPSAEPEPDLLSDGHLMRIIKAAPGWLDLQRTLRREGLVLRLSECGQSLQLHSWPEDRLLMPLSALGLTLEGLCLHFRAPFPGGGGLSRVLRALVTADSDTGRAA